MKYLELKIDCKEPVKVSAAINSKGTSESLSYISGSLIRGSFISQYIKQTGVKDIAKDVKAKELFFNGKLEFLNGYIKLNNKRTIPMPQGIYADAVDVLKYSEGKQINLKNELIDIIEDTDKKLPAEDFIELSEDEATAASVDRIYNLHIKKGTEKDLFRYEAIEEGQSFVSYIKCDVSEEEIQEIKSIIENGKFYLGGSKGSGYGKVSINVTNTYENNPEQQLFKNDRFKDEFIIYTLSDGIFLDDFGAAIGHIDENYLKSSLELEEVKLEEAVTDNVLVGGYNNKWGCRLPQYYANKAGSLFRYSYKGFLSEEILAKLTNKGIGLRTDEGYGRIAIVPSFIVRRINKAN